MSRAPEFEPILDAVAVVALVDPCPAQIRHLQRIDRWTHALFTGWGGSGLWLPLHMDETETPDDVQIKVRTPPGVEYVHLRALVSHRDKTTPRTAEASVASSTSGTSTTLTWQEAGVGNTLDGALEVATSGAVGAANGPLQVRSGTAWSWNTDTWTITFDAGKGHIWGLCVTPIHTPR